MSTTPTQNHQFPTSLSSTPAAPTSSKEMETKKPSITGNELCALPLRVRELKPSTQHLIYRPSQKYGVRKIYQRVISEQPEVVYPLHEVNIYTQHDEKIFLWDITLCKYAQQVRHPQCIVSQFVSSDDNARSIVVREPVTRCRPFYRNMIFAEEFSSATLKQIKKTLRSYVRLLYQLGLGYTVTPEGTYVLRTRNHTGWAIHLRNVMYSDFCDKPLRKKCGWDLREQTQYEQIERIFGPIEMSVAREEAWRKSQQEKRA